MSKETVGQDGHALKERRTNTETTDRPYEAEDRCAALLDRPSTPVEKVEMKADVNCHDCTSEPVRDEYKGDQVLRCSNCGAILVRNVKS